MQLPIKTRVRATSPPLMCDAIDYTVSPIEQPRLRYFSGSSMCVGPEKFFVKKEKNKLFPWLSHSCSPGFLLNANDGTFSDHKVTLRNDEGRVDFSGGYLGVMGLI